MVLVVNTNNEVKYDNMKKNVYVCNIYFIEQLQAPRGYRMGQSSKLSN